MLIFGILESDFYIKGQNKLSNVIVVIYATGAFMNIMRFKFSNCLFKRVHHLLA